MECNANSIVGRWTDRARFTLEVELIEAVYLSSTLLRKKENLIVVRHTCSVMDHYNGGSLTSLLLTLNKCLGP